MASMRNATSDLFWLLAPLASTKEVPATKPYWKLNYEGCRHRQLETRPMKQLPLEETGTLVARGEGVACVVSPRPSQCCTLVCRGAVSSEGTSAAVLIPSKIAGTRSRQRDIQRDPSIFDEGFSGTDSV